MRHLYITGGHQRFRLLKTEREWNLYDMALVLKVDTETREIETKLEYVSPPEVCAKDGLPSVFFKAGTLYGKQLFICTSTEVFAYKLPTFERTKYLSLPCFNDLHHVYRASDGRLFAANTGLDMVVEFTFEAGIKHVWNTLGLDPWKRFSVKKDYRHIASTKPHHSHPNFVFQIGGDYWVTRGKQGDAFCLTSPGRNVKITSYTPHDGFLHRERIYFTTVDGTIVIVNQQSLKIEEVVDLKLIGNESRALLGWCRGLLVLDEKHVWVGFTRVRKTKFKQHINWVKHVFHNKEKPTHIALYDIESKKRLKEIDLEENGLNVLFGIFPGDTDPED